MHPPSGKDVLRLCPLSGPGDRELQQLHWSSNNCFPLALHFPGAEGTWCAGTYQCFRWTEISLPPAYQLSGFSWQGCHSVGDTKYPLEECFPWCTCPSQPRDLAPLSGAAEPLLEPTVEKALLSGTSPLRDRAAGVPPAPFLGFPVQPLGAGMLPGMMPWDDALACCAGMLCGDAAGGCCPGMLLGDASRGCCLGMMPWGAARGCCQEDAAGGCCTGMLPGMLSRGGPGDCTGVTAPSSAVPAHRRCMLGREEAQLGLLSKTNQKEKPTQAAPSVCIEPLSPAS